MKRGLQPFITDEIQFDRPLVKRQVPSQSILGGRSMLRPYKNQSDERRAWGEYLAIYPVALE